LATGPFGAFRLQFILALFMIADSGSLCADSVLSSFYKNVHADASEPILKGIAEFENRASAPALGWTCIKSLEPIAVQNNDAFLHLLIGFAASERNLYKLAQPHLEQSLANLNRDYPATPELHFAARYWLGRTYLGQGLDDKAEAVLREAVDVIAKQPGLYEKSILWPNKSICDSFVKSMVARLLFDYQREESALSYYLQIDSMRTSGSDYHHAVYYTGSYPADLARCYAALGKHKEAVQWFETALSRSKWNWCEQVMLHIDAGWQALAAEDFDEALKHAESALSLQKYCRSALVISARAKIAKGDFDNAAKDAWTAWHLDNDHPDVVETFRLLKEKAGRDFAEWQSATKPVKPEDRWNNFPIFVWLDKEGPEKNEKFYELLKSVGINGCAITGRSDSDFLTKCGMLFYVENAIRGEYLRMNRDSYKEQMERYAKDNYDTSWMTRPKSFFDPSDKEVALRDMYGIVVQHGPNKPMAYSLGDEISYGCLVNPMDLDIDARAMKAFRKWLETRYGTIEKLNSVWETAYKSFGEVELWDVEKTRLRALKAGPDKYNFAPWNDHLEFNDELFAKELKNLVDCFHDLDPWTPVGIGGAQVPAAFGGYDWSKLANVFDSMEPYFNINTREVIQSFSANRKKLLSVMTLYPDRPGYVDKNIRDTAYHLAEGASGQILWSSKDIFAKDTNPKLHDAYVGKNFHNFLPRDMTTLASARRASDGVYIYLTQRNSRLAWLFEALNDQRWSRRFGSYSREGSSYVMRRKLVWDALDISGYCPMYANDAMLTGSLSWPGTAPKLIVLSDSISLNDRERDWMTTFVKEGGVLLIHGLAPGTMDTNLVNITKPDFLNIPGYGKDRAETMKTLKEHAFTVFDDSGEFVAHKPVGKGTIILCTTVAMPNDPQKLSEQMTMKLAEILGVCFPPVCKITAPDKAAWNVRTYLFRQKGVPEWYYAIVNIQDQFIDESHKLSPLDHVTITCPGSGEPGGVKSISVPYWGIMPSKKEEKP
jgi:tetratricopeptide (TPR) repeat protein